MRLQRKTATKVEYLEEICKTELWYVIHAPLLL